MERGADLRKMHPLRHRFEVIHRLPALDFREAGELFSGRPHEVGEKRRVSNLQRRELLVTHVRQDIELLLELGVEKTDQAVVLELFTNGANEDRRQTSLRGLGRLPKLAQ